jgi:Ca2+-transporting ATPase
MRVLAERTQARPSPRLASPAPAWSLPSDEVLAGTRSDRVLGLSAPEAQERLAVAGPNDVRLERTPPLWRSVAAQLQETMILVLLAALALTILTGDRADAAVIALVVAVNTTMGVVQERRALHAVAALRSLSAPAARVRRDGQLRSVPASTLVPGDLVLVRTGDVVPADARLLEAHDLDVDEALLTGESVPSSRRADARLAPDTPVAERVTMLHSGTTVAHGRGEAVVVATGATSEVGRLATLLSRESAPATPLQRRLRRLSRGLSAAAVAACLVVSVLGLLRGEDWETVLLTGISLAVAAIPESLPAVVALALAGGARRMARRGAIVRSLPAVETLGSVTLLATDKTGTLTRGSMECITAWTPRSARVPLDGRPLPADVRDLLRAAVLCNDAGPRTTGAGHGTEGALVAAAEGHGLDVEDLRRAYPRLREVPFTSARRSMTTWHGGTPRLEIIKGAPEAVLRSVPADTATARAEAVGTAWAADGRRVLAVAIGADGARPALAGLLALADPLRPEARDAVLACRRAGMTPVLVTGDHPGTASAIARAVGLADGAAEERVHARIDPAGKLALIRAWQDSGHVVAMTGDGVNDAPALRAADIGVAMGVRGTDVAKQAADIVLTDDSLSTVVAAVTEGRRVFDNIRRFVRYGVAGGLAEIAVMIAGPFLGLALPLLPAQILWVNLLTHGLPGVAIGAEPAESDVGLRPPRPPAEGIVTRRIGTEITLLAAVMTAACLAVAVYAHASGSPWQSMLFATLALAQLGVALSTRSDSQSLWRLRWSGNPLLLVAVALSAALTVAALYVPSLAAVLHTAPLTPGELAVATLAAAVPGVSFEVLKSARRYGRRAHPRPLPTNEHQPQRGGEPR